MARKLAVPPAEEELWDDAGVISTALSLYSAAHFAGRRESNSDGGNWRDHERAGTGGLFAASPSVDQDPRGADGRLFGDGPAVFCGGDRRKKRMMKNRESAARSRARKQAYVHQLEKELKYLERENAQLKMIYELKAQEQITLELPVPKQSQLARTLSAPF